MLLPNQSTRELVLIPFLDAISLTVVWVVFIEEESDTKFHTWTDAF